MRALQKSAIVLGMAGAMALGSMTASDARVRPWVAGAAGFAVGAAVGAAAANAAYYNGYYGPAYAYEPSYAYEPAYAYEPTYVQSTYVQPGYDAYAYAPRYHRRGYYRGYGYDASTQSWPPHYDPGAGYNSNTLAPWQDQKLQGTDY